MEELSFSMKRYKLLNKTYFLIFCFLSIGCKREIKNDEIKQFFTLTNVRIANDVHNEILSYLSSEKIEKANKHPIIVCKYFTIRDNNFILIGQYEKHEYFFSERGFIKNTFCIKNDSLTIIIEISKNLSDENKLGIFLTEEHCVIDFPNAWGYTSIVPDSVIPSVVKKNIKHTKKGWINYHTSANRWLFKLNNDGNIIKESLRIHEGGIPLAW
ncbi:hypothetical protein [Leptobacterium sp. I13]|uniref:hypothetical protein n=1 Tax=Leptobacterium meishanense TaxID=3128904 RepID=UPI0030ED4138